MVLSVKILTAVRVLEMPFYYEQLVKLALVDEYLTDVDKKDEIIKTLFKSLFNSSLLAKTR